MATQFHPFVSTIIPPIAPFFTVLRESSVSDVIPDFLIGFWDVEPPKPPVVLTGMDCELLSTIVREEMDSVAALASEYFISEQAMRASLKRLSRAGYLSTEANIFQTLPERCQSLCHVIAVEMKLSRWREALDQAITYQRFADESFVILDSTRFDPTPEILGLFKRHNVGLLVFDSYGFRNLHRPLPSAPWGRDRVWVLDKLARATLHQA